VIGPIGVPYTTEYATGVGVHSVKSNTRLKLPAKFFTYQVLNLDDMTQALFVQVLGPGGFPIQKAVYIRSLDDYGSVYTRGFELRVPEYEPEPRVPPTVAACVCRGRWPGGCSTTSGRT
jgi:hypothetical protein